MPRHAVWGVVFATVLLWPLPQASSAPFDDPPAMGSRMSLSTALLSIDRLLLQVIPLSSPAERGPTMLAGPGSPPAKARSAAPSASPAKRHVHAASPARPSADGAKAASRARTASTARPSARAVRPGDATLTHRVQRGDTLFALARRYGTTVAGIAAASGLASAHRIREGQILAIPAGKVPTGTRTAAVAQRPGFGWPVRGVLTSRFGWRYRRHHDGIDLASAWGTPIYAARAGRVIRAGWYGGYGRTVILDHGDGLTTLYAHASRILVRVGQRVARGQAIALVGCTGACTGPHLHFEVRKQGRAVNPLAYLR